MYLPPMFRRLFFSCFVSVLFLILYAQPKTDKQLMTILNSSKNAVLQKVLSDTHTYRCQIIYTEINRDKKNQPSFKNYYFNYDPLLYFNPASMVKLPMALLSLEKLNEINKPGV